MGVGFIRITLPLPNALRALANARFVSMTWDHSCTCTEKASYLRGMPLESSPPHVVCLYGILQA